MTEPVNATAGAISLATERSIDLTAVTGTGADGRITKGDVETFLAAAEAAAPVVDTAVSVDQSETAVATVVFVATDDDVRAQTPAAEPEAADEQPPLFAYQVQEATTLTELIALGDRATSEAERAVIRARAKGLLSQ